MQWCNDVFWCALYCTKLTFGNHLQRFIAMLTFRWIICASFPSSTSSLSHNVPLSDYPFYSTQIYVRNNRLTKQTFDRKVQLLKAKSKTVFRVNVTVFWDNPYCFEETTNERLRFLKHLFYPSFLGHRTTGLTNSLIIEHAWYASTEHIVEGKTCLALGLSPSGKWCN